MKLGTRLLLISVGMISLPVAGWQMVRALEESLRESYQEALIDTARSIAAEIGGGPVELPPPGALFAHRADRPFVVDGHSGDWSTWLDEAQDLQAQTESASVGARIVAAERGSRLHLLVRVADDNLVLAGPDNEPGDRVELEVTADGRRSGATVAPLAPGWLSTRGPDGWLRVQAALQPGERGWTMEIAIEQPRTISALSLRVVDVESARDRSPAAIHGTAGALRLARPSSRLAQRLAARLPEGTRGWVTGPDGWIVARAGGARPETSGFGTQEDEGFLAAAAARMLGILPEASPRRDAARDRLDAGERRAEATANWYQQPEGNGFVVSAGAPINRNEAVAGHVVIERPADRFMTRAYRSLLQLFGFGLLGMITIAAVLIGFSVWLSARIRRLRNAAEAAVDSDGRVRERMPTLTGGDELADLGRSLSSMVERQHQHQDYLRTLASKLSHELRTPLAMIRSSLDNLAEVDDVQSSERYRQRAREGCDRLQRMFQAMSQAARVEESLSDEPLIALDLGELVSAYAQACQATFAHHRIVARVPAHDTARILGAPEQLAQMLDKLVENAVDFSVPGSRITLRVVPLGRDISLQVDNPGPPLPAGESGRLFESMTSSRRADERGAHLGLGLHIVRLIAQRHGGRVRALDRPDGVRFQVDFPRNGVGNRTRPEHSDR